MKKRNVTMDILTGFTIILVILGHIDWGILTVHGLFQYYSFHVLVFVFISGYFYKEEDENDLKSFLLRKAKNLLLPYFICQIPFAFISDFLSKRGFAFCKNISLHNFFVDPFLGGHAFGLNYAAWFVPALFIIQVVYIVTRRISRLLHINREWIIFLIWLALGMVTVYLAKGGHVWGYYKTPGRILFMMPAFCMGRMYKCYLEKKDTAPWYIYYPVVIAVQLVIYYISDGRLIYSAVWCTGFASYIFIPYISTITGIALWLRISREIGRFKVSKILSVTGQNSFAVMMFHVSVIFCINLVTLAITGVIQPVNAFDMTSFMENVNYTYLVGGMKIWKAFYLLLTVAIPVLASVMFKSVKSHIRDKKNR